MTVSRLYFLDAQCPKKTWESSLGRVKFCTRGKTEHNTLYAHPGNIKHSLTISEVAEEKTGPVFLWDRWGASDNLSLHHLESLHHKLKQKFRTTNFNPYWSLVIRCISTAKANSQFFFNSPDGKDMEGISSRKFPFPTTEGERKMVYLIRKK